jgi:GDP-L-fucose synthase
VSRVLVTGGGGFVGSHLVERLEAAGHDVVAARRRDHDLTSMEETARLFDEARPELVFHLAAEVGGIGANRANPGRYWYANLMMGAHVLEQSRLHEVGKVVTAGTVCSYPKFTPVPFREDELWNGYPEETNAPYGVAKKALLVGGQAYREQYGLNAIHLLPANLYGPRDNFDLESSHVIPALIRKMVTSKEEVVLWGDGSPSREFLYVDDCVEALLLAAERYDGAEPVNLGTGVETSIRELAETVADVTGFEGEIVWDTSMPNGQPRRSLDASRAAELFGFRAGTPLRDGLERTVAWFRESALVGEDGPARADGLLEQRQPLGEDHILVGELRDHGRVVEQHREDEQRRDREQHRRRIPGHAEPARDRVQPAAPRGEHEQDEARDQPEDRVPLAEPPAADQLEHDQEQEQRRHRGDDRDLERRHSSSTGRTRRRKIPTSRASVTLIA